MIPALASGMSLHYLSSAAKMQVDQTTLLPTLSSALTETLHQAEVRNLSFQAWQALGGRVTVGRWTCHFIDYLPLILLGIVSRLPAKLQPPLEWVQRHNTVINQGISTVAAGVLLTKGQRNLGAAVLGFTLYHIVCRRQWISHRVQTMVGRPLFFVISCYQLTRGPIWARLMTAISLVDFIWRNSQSLWGKAKMPNPILIDAIHLPLIDNLVINRNHIFVKEAEPEYHSFLKALANERTRIYKAIWKATILQDQIFRLLDGKDESGLPLTDLFCHHIVGGNIEMEYSSSKSAIPVFLFPMKKVFEWETIDEFWDQYDLDAMVRCLIENTSDELEQWANTRRIANQEPETLAKLLLVEMSVVVDPRRKQ